MKFIIGKKIEMTQKFHKDGTVVPVTAVRALECFITQIKLPEKDGYFAIQVGAEAKDKKIKKPQRGHIKGISKELDTFHEFRILQEEDIEFLQKMKKSSVGKSIDLSSFSIGDKIHVVGVSKGKGFQGVVKRHGFSGGPASHGHKDQLRMPGSIGDTNAAHVMKGKKMAGRMGGKSVTVKNLEIVDIDSENRIFYIKGAIPGVRNSTVFISGNGQLKLVE